MAYVHHTEFFVDPENLSVWRPHARNLLSAMARREELLSMRLYQDVKQSSRFISVAVWRSQYDFQRALGSPDVKLVASAEREHRQRKTGSSSPEEVVRELELIDHVFGRKGPRAFLPPAGGFAQHLFTHVPVNKREAWEPYRRNCGSVMARQSGVASYEMMQDLSDPTIVLVLRNYEGASFASIMKGAAPAYRPNREIQYATRPALDLELYKDAKAVEYTDCEFWDGVVGPNGIELYQEFMESLEPV